MFIIEWYNTNTEKIAELVVEGQEQLYKAVGILNKHQHEIITIEVR